MCGITGVLNYDGEDVSQNTLKSMTEAIIHRGPDDEGYYFNKNVGLGHRRLKIIDLSDAGKQPMISDDGKIVLSYNGEIYNFRELREELQKLGHKFKSATDTEVLLKGYIHFGINYIERLNGMFAFSIWDDHKKSLIIGNDRYGIKPLYIWNTEKYFVFASEIKSILKHPEYKIQVDYSALNEYFTFQNLFRYHTLFKEIQLLAPAKILTINIDGSINSRTYWDYDFTSTDKNIDPQYATQETLRLFQNAVKLQLTADVPVGSYLSGGMDSGSITAVASSYIPKLSTFTCGFDLSKVIGREANFDERKDAELMSSFFKTEHYEQIINAGDIQWSLPKVIYSIEDIRLGMSYPNYYISRLASKFVKVCLSGAGGDELFGGYPWRYYTIFNSSNAEDFYRSYYKFWQRIVNDEDKKELFTAETSRNIIDDDRSMYDVFKRVFTFNTDLNYESKEDYISNSLYFEAKTFLRGLFIIGDKLSMVNSLEERFPFMDNELVNFSQKIPIRLKLGDFDKMQKVDENELKKIKAYQSQFNTGKNILRASMSSLIPKEILNRKKQGFSAPDESWYRGENLEYVTQILLSKDASYASFINYDYVKKVVDEHVNKHINHRLLIWSFLSFEWWCKIFLEGKTEMINQ